MEERVYALAGLRIVSDIALPFLPPWRGRPLDGQVLIRRAGVPRELGGSAEVFEDGAWDGERLLIECEGVARYLVTRDAIGVESLDAVDPRETRAYLMGTVFGAFCHLRGILPLHASSICYGNACLAFAGDSGAGKSTIAAALSRRGHPVIADDTTYVRPGPQVFEVLPGTARLRLWQDSMDGLGYDCSSAEREMRGWEKFLVPVTSLAYPLASPALRRIYVLERSAPDCRPAIERLKGAVAIEVLLENIYRLGLAERMGLRSFIFEICARLAREVPVFRLARPFDFDDMGDVLALVERHASEETAGGAVAAHR